VMEYKMVGDHPEDLADGRVLGPGEVTELSDEDLEDPHNQRLIEEGVLIPVEETEEQSPKSKSSRAKQKEGE
jgi:hypothetical protein